MGVIRKPNEIHALQGTGKKCRGTTTLVEIAGELARKPELQQFELGIDRQKIFDQLTAWVKRLTGQAAVDELLLSILVDQYELYSMAKIDVMERGMMMVTDDGDRANRSLVQMNNALDKIHKMMREFGMTPATRGQVKASMQIDNDPFDLMFK